MEEQVISFLLNFASSNPKIASVMMIIGGFRLILKPIMAGIEAYVKESESKKDDQILLEVKENKIYKIVMFVLDYLLSIKSKSGMIK